MSLTESIKKNLVLVISIVALCASLLSVAFSGILLTELYPVIQAAKPVVISKQYDKGQSLSKALEKNKPVIVFFYTDWCRYCQKFVPTYAKATKDSQIKKNFAVAYVNCEDLDNANYVKEFQINSYPSVFVIKNDKTKQKIDNGLLFGANAKDEIIKFANEFVKK